MCPVLCRQPLQKLIFAPLPYQAANQHIHHLKLVRMDFSLTIRESVRSIQALL